MRRAVAFVLLFSVLAAARADIYRSVDAQGNVQYSDTPSPGAELVSTGEMRSPIPSSATEPSKLTSLAERTGQANQQLAAQAAARAVEHDTAEAHGKQCQQARQTYQSSVDARRLYKTGTDGEREFLSDQEADQLRVKYKLAMDTACEGVSDQSSGDSQSSNGGPRSGVNSNAPAQ